VRIALHAVPARSCHEVRVFPRGIFAARARAMSLHRCSLSGALVALVFAFSRSSAGASGDYEREDDLTFEVVSCEEAFARLEECCPGFQVPDNGCRDYRYRRTSSCNGNVQEGGTDPTFTLDESRCIREKSCEAIVGERLCILPADGRRLCR
jgi:hypothetical protein